MRFNAVSKAYGPTVVFDRFSLTVEPKTILAVVGPSGQGKTTLLHLASGLIAPDSGSVIRDTSESGSVSYLFQEPRLIPTATVFHNVELALRASESNTRARCELAQHYLEMVGLSDSFTLYPQELSGGMRQRVAIARSFAHPSNLMLLDEPFQSLDIKLRYALLEAFLTLWEESPKTTIFVTHDPKEAIVIGDAVCCLGSPNAPIFYEKIDTPRSARSIHDSELLSLEASLIEALLNA
ncbi:MAG TPA: ATP-binding cassette domain-containing protein [Sphaerochaeta sp.]|nr:ATP-binding cassette domain-containing protein [Sphaerochaeta sp.]